MIVNSSDFDIDRYKYVPATFEHLYDGKPFAIRTNFLTSRTRKRKIDTRYYLVIDEHILNIFNIISTTSRVFKGYLLAEGDIIISISSTGAFYCRLDLTITHPLSIRTPVSAFTFKTELVEGSFVKWSQIRELLLLDLLTDVRCYILRILIEGI
jgi:hypothetical protein